MSEAINHGFWPANTIRGMRDQPLISAQTGKRSIALIACGFKQICRIPRPCISGLSCYAACTMRPWKRDGNSRFIVFMKPNTSRTKKRNAPGKSRQQQTDKIYAHAVSCHQEGRLAEAEALYRQILSTDAYHADSLHMLGVLACQAGHFKQAVDLTNRAIMLNPGVAIYHSDLGLALQGQGRLDDAINCYEQALAIRPDVPEVLNNLGALLCRQGRVDDAVARYEQALAIRPDYPDALNNFGILLKGQGRLDEAVSCYERALAVRPDVPEVLNNLGAALYHQGRVDEAIARYEQALAIRPDYPDALNNFGNLLRGQGRLDEAIARYEQALAIRPDYPDALSNLGNALSDQGRVDEAIARYEQALAIRPDYPNTLNSLGVALHEQGRLDEAIACYEKALAIQPDFAECHRHIGALKTYRHDDPHIPILRRLYKTVSNESDRIHACFALAKACEDMNEIDESFSLYAEGNKLRKEELGYTIDRDRKLFDRIKSAFDRPDVSTRVPLQSTVPILIVGMPRSGTSLVEQILASHSDVYGAGELRMLETLVRQHFPDMPDFDPAAASSRITADYLEGLDQMAGEKHFITDKMPGNFRWLGFLLSVQPDIRIIHTTRDPMAVCWSNFRQYFPAQGLGFPYDLSDLAEYYLMHEELMRFWHERFPGRIYDLSYEQLTENQEIETRKLLDYCGLDWEDRCLEFEKTERSVKTASAAQIRNKMYQGSSKAWCKFESHLGPLIEGLANGSGRKM